MLALKIVFVTFPVFYERMLSDTRSCFKFILCSVKKMRKLHCLEEERTKRSRFSINIRGASIWFHNSYLLRESKRKQVSTTSKHNNRKNVSRSHPSWDQGRGGKAQSTSITQLSCLWQLPSSAVKGFGPAMRLGSSKRLQRRHNHSAFHVGFTWIRTNLDKL